MYDKDEGLMEFVWDDEKDKKNREKHKICFETASRVFLDPNRLDILDREHSTDGEERRIVIGRVYKVLFVVYTERGEAIRLISARFASAEEKRLYYDETI